MALANAAPVNTRAVRDINYIKNVALPGAGNTANTNGMDLIQATPYPTSARVICQVLTTGGNGANNKNINVVLQHSADDNTSNYANITQFKAPLLTVVDNNGGGYNVGYANVLLPPDVKRYVRAQAATEANGGDPSGAVLSLQLLF